MSDGAGPIRPYFLPQSIDYEALSDAEKLAIETIVVPAYEELVLGAGSALERSVAISLVFLLCEEIVDQFALGTTLPLGREAGADAERRNRMAGYLRSLNAKMTVASFVLRIKQARLALDPLRMATL